ncbi:hypothetical protein [Microvirga ossetica]|nr:hypothetical protein [Microvirga ossetica]
MGYLPYKGALITRRLNQIGAPNNLIDNVLILTAITAAVVVYLIARQMP